MSKPGSKLTAAQRVAMDALAASLTAEDLDQAVELHELLWRIALAARAGHQPARRVIAVQWRASIDHCAADGVPMAAVLAELRASLPEDN